MELILILFRSSNRFWHHTGEGIHIRTITESIAVQEQIPNPFWFWNWWSYLHIGLNKDAELRVSIFYELGFCSSIIENELNELNAHKIQRPVTFNVVGANVNAESELKHTRRMEIVNLTEDDSHLVYRIRLTESGSIVWRTYYLISPCIIWWASRTEQRSS